MQHIKVLPNYLAKRLERWRKTTFEDNREWYSHLAEHGQHPRAMFISCCDSRVDPVGMFEGEPGDFFLVRNVANLVPPYSPDRELHGTSAAIEYAVTVLGVSHIVILGHSGCGGVAACYEKCEGAGSKLDEDSSFISRWMDILTPGYERIKDIPGDRAERLQSLEHESIKVSLENLLTFPFVRDAVDNGRLAMHGAWTDIGSGELHAYDGSLDQFRPI
ncbi:carbonic anhydrase [Pontivivens nitratireducens]|jgi:carbonic anhydrase|uniref:Carbonic anhydrase n=1 Tax=Pontivivens nitratireducens TaxID=2758038 RepID=A0A6G7VI99_9RHOB|nr:carbonic anhydrase [Pontibrevibacter nitratireducens]QIK39517.1 carbonic anhydrase [Pontibrevibacter nitratireducens]